MNDDKATRYSDDANLPPEREHDTHEPEEAQDERAGAAPEVDTGTPAGRVLEVNEDGTVMVGIGALASDEGDVWFLDGSQVGEPPAPFLCVERERDLMDRDHLVDGKEPNATS